MRAFAVGRPTLGDIFAREMHDGVKWDGCGEMHLPGFRIPDRFRCASDRAAAQRQDAMPARRQPRNERRPDESG